ncbi:MAG: single-stranded DNA-binding protein [Rhodospirillaceae bacterium]|jgi:single-strand DNA-binding protein|nr:single-stranded DNA-binding protein [Rhodospirillaceae bacterium]
MAGSINKVILIGNLGADPELRNSQNGSKIVSFNIATSESWKDRTTGERKEKTEWHRIVIFNDYISDIAQKYLKKGSKVYVEGTLQTRKWTDQGGVEKDITEIIINKFKGELALLGNSQQNYKETSNYNSEFQNDIKNNIANNTGSDWNVSDELDDEIPF